MFFIFYFLSLSPLQQIWAFPSSLQGYPWHSPPSAFFSRWKRLSFLCPLPGSRSWIGLTALQWSGREERQADGWLEEGMNGICDRPCHQPRREIIHFAGPPAVSGPADHCVGSWFLHHDNRDYVHHPRQSPASPPPQQGPHPAQDQSSSPHPKLGRMVGICQWVLGRGATYVCCP